jgi:branched-chain amino acid transport system ATP-binding protein
VNATAPTAALEARGIEKSYGGLRAVAGVSFAVHAGEVLGIAGPNGAGKTTLFDVISGLTGANHGSVLLDGQPITNLTVHRRCRLGLARTFQQPTIADSLTVMQNVMIGAYFGGGGGRPISLLKGVDRGRWADRILRFVGLMDKADAVARPLGVFDKKRLMLATALATSPRVLLLDEPFGGLNPTEIQQTIELIANIRAGEVAVVCIEHVMRALTALADRVLVMHNGATLFEGTPDGMLADSRVIAVYLGTQTGEVTS